MMTLEHLRALCDAPGWSTGRVARAIGRAPDTVRGWLRGEPMGRAAADWLARVDDIIAEHGPESGRETVLVIVRAPSGPERE